MKAREQGENISKIRRTHSKANACVATILDLKNATMNDIQFLEVNLIQSLNFNSLILKNEKKDLYNSGAPYLDTMLEFTRTLDSNIFQILWIFRIVSNFFQAASKFILITVNRCVSQRYIAFTS